jgi:hypothetical protein
VTPTVVERPLLITIISIVSILAGLIVLVAMAVLLVISVVYAKDLALYVQLHPLMFVLSGFNVGFLGLAIIGGLTGAYALVQGYGFWKLRAWSWWLYVASVIASLLLRVVITVVHPRLINDSTSLLLGFGGLVLLGYLIMRRDRFNVEIPKLPF